MKKLNRLENVFGWLLLISVAIFIGSFFIWAWHSWELAWRIGLSAGVSCIVLAAMVNTIKEAKRHKERSGRPAYPPKRSSFSERLEQLRKQQEHK